MRWRTLRIALLLFEALWLNVIVPGHTRGIVPLPGTECAACAEREARFASCDLPASRPGHPGQPHPAGDPASHCAICHFAARISLPAVVDLTPPKLALIGFCRESAPVTITSIKILPTYDGRAPPVLA